VLAAAIIRATSARHLIASPFKLLLIALKMEEANTSETSLNFYQTARSNYPEDSRLYFVNKIMSTCDCDVNDKQG
jgi:hypothetical protein